MLIGNKNLSFGFLSQQFRGARKPRTFSFTHGPSGDFTLSYISVLTYMYFIVITVGYKFRISVHNCRLINADYIGKLLVELQLTNGNGTVYMQLTPEINWASVAKREDQENKSIDQYMTKLRISAHSCKFCDCLNESQFERESCWGSKIPEHTSNFC